MADKTVKITIDGMGNPNIEAVGFQGVGCAEATAGIERALAGNGKGVSKEYKPEWTQGRGKSEQKIKQSW